MQILLLKIFVKIKFKNKIVPMDEFIKSGGGLDV